MASLSIILSLNGLQADVFRQPELCDEAQLLGLQFLDKVELARDFSLALQKPRPQKSRSRFLRFVFEQGDVHDQRALDRKLKLRALDGISLVLCATTYTENMILGFSDARFQTLLTHCSDFLGNSTTTESRLSIGVIETSLAVPIIPIDGVAYRRFRTDLERLQQSWKPARVSVDLDPSHYHMAYGECTLTWPQEEVMALLHGSQHGPFSVILRQMARLYKETGRNIPFSSHMIEASVAISKSGPLGDRMQVLAAAAEVLTDSAPVSAWAAVVHQRSVVQRLQGNAQSSEQEILTCIRRFSHIPDHLLKPLQLSLANNHIYQLNHLDAHEITRNIQIAEDHHEDQIQMLWDYIYCVGRIMRGQGDFESARVCFERCSATHGIKTPKKIVVQSALADLYCELDYTHQNDQHQHLLQARSLLEPALESVSVANSKSRRRLLLSLSEVNIREDRVLEARELLEELLVLYGSLEHLDVIDRLGHVRSYLALARTYPPGTAEMYWRNALRLNAEYNPSEEEVFTCAVIYLNLSWLSYCSGELNGAQELSASAQKVLSRKRPEYLLPGVGTYIFDEIRCKLQRAGL